MRRTKAGAPRHPARVAARREHATGGRARRRCRAALPTAVIKFTKVGNAGAACFAKCDGEWCNGHGSARVGADGRCACTCFSALGWVGRRCDECGGTDPFFPVRAHSGGIARCTLCTNAVHCSSRAVRVAVNSSGSGCECSCVQGYNGSECGECAQGFVRFESSGTCERRRQPCVVRDARGDPRGATARSHWNNATGRCKVPVPGPDVGTQCVGGLAIHYNCTDEVGSGCTLTFPTATAYDFIEKILTIVTSVLIIWLAANNCRKYRNRFSAPVYSVPYKWYDVVCDILSACMIVADVGLDVSACIEATRYERATGRHTRSTWMMAMLVIPHVLRVGIVCLKAFRDQALCREVARQAALATVIGPLDDMRQTVHIVMQLSRDGVQTELNVHLSKRLALFALVELFESVPQLMIQCFFIAELRSSRGYLALDNTSYFFIFASPCISVTSIVKGITGWVAITRGRTAARRAATEAGVQRSGRVERMITAPYLSCR
eukprot:gene19769-biopygen27635